MRQRSGAINNGAQIANINPPAAFRAAKVAVHYLLRDWRCCSSGYLSKVSGFSNAIGKRHRHSQSHPDTLLSRYESIWDELPDFRHRNPLGTCRNRGPSTRRVGSHAPQDKPRSRRRSIVGGLERKRRPLIR